MPKAHESDHSQALRGVMATYTETDPSDWFCVFKTRYGMEVVLSTLRDVRGEGEVATQLFTCCTAVVPIMQAGLTPRYVDISRDTLAVDPDTVPESENLRAVVMQHTFGIINGEADERLCVAAHRRGALLVEDSAHCAGTFSRGADGQPLADVSIHSFGVEKMVSDCYFGGMVWINPLMEDLELRAALVEALTGLPEADAARDRAASQYRNQTRLLTRLPARQSASMRVRMLSHGTFEPPVADEELAGTLPLQACAPGPWVCGEMMAAIGRLESIERGRSACVNAYLDVFSNAIVPEGLELPADLSVLTDQHLLRFPVSLETSALADRARMRIGQLGYYAVRWGNPLLFPGVSDEAAFHWDGSTEGYPVTGRWSKGVVGLPTDIEPEQAADVARLVLALSAGSFDVVFPSSKGDVDAAGESGEVSTPANLALIKTEADVSERLVPVCVGGDLLAYTYVREFHKEYGIRPIVLSSINVRMTSSSALCDYRIVPGMNDEQTVVDYLDALGHDLAAQGKVGLLLGLADWQARVLSQHKAELSRWYVVPYIDFELLDEITQKRRFYEICEELGIPYPKTWYLSCPQEHEPLDTTQFPYPLIAKPSNSAAWDEISFSGKKKIYEIETPEEFEKAYEAVCASAYEHELVVQDFVPGGDDAIRSLTTFSDAQGDMRVVSGGRVALQDHSPLALGNPVCILSEKVDAIVSDAARFLKHVGYRGYANFDIKYDSRDGSYRFFEVNTRPGRNTFYVSLGGMSYVRPIVDEFVLGREVPYTEAYDPFLYTIVPPIVVKRSVEDDALRSDVLAAYRDGRASNPLDYVADCVAHKMWSTLYTQNQIRKFKKYLWDTGGKQAEVD